METKPLLYGLIGFFIGGLIVALAATTLNTPTENTMNDMSMNDMNSHLSDLSGDDYDKAFIEMMIAHHEGAVDMAKLSEQNAKHEEIKQLSRDIISAQEQEIAEMNKWHAAWGYGSDTIDRHQMSH
jgi:uncharacterized protein (DUF305 family)